MRMLIGQNIRNANNYMTLSPTSWQLASEANEQEAHALIADYVHNMFIGFAVPFLINPFSHPMFCKDSICSVCSIWGLMLLPTFFYFVLNTCHPPHPKSPLLSLSTSLSFSYCLSLSVCLSISPPVFLLVGHFFSIHTGCFSNPAPSPLCLHWSPLPAVSRLWNCLRHGETRAPIIYSLPSTPHLLHVCIGAFAFLF